MIVLTRLSGTEFVLNSDLIERIDVTPDTVITLTDGSKYVVAESLRAVVAEIRLHRAEVIALSDYVQVDQTLVSGTSAEDDPRGAIADRGHRRDRRQALATVTAHPTLAEHGHAHGHENAAHRDGAVTTTTLLGVKR